MRQVTTFGQANQPLHPTDKNPNLLIAYFKQFDLQLLVIPGLLLILVFNYFPMYGLVMAFQDYNIFEGIFKSEFVGFKHFIRFF